jgi:hypothetical protein
MLYSASSSFPNEFIWPMIHSINGLFAVCIRFLVSLLRFELAEHPIRSFYVVLSRLVVSFLSFTTQTEVLSVKLTFETHSGVFLRHQLCCLSQGSVFVFSDRLGFRDDPGNDATASSI